MYRSIMKYSSLLILIVVFTTEFYSSVSANGLIENQQSQTNSIQLSLAELSRLPIVGSSEFHGRQSNERFDLLIPSDWEIQPGASLNLHLATNVGQQGIISSVQIIVYLNSRWVYQTILTSPGDRWLAIDLPDYWLPKENKVDSNQLEIQVSVPVGCDENLSHATYLFYDSQININYSITDLPLDLSNYPSPIYSSGFYKQKINVLLPPSVSQDFIEPSLSIAAELGKRSTNNIDWNVYENLSLNEIASLQGNIILLGTPETNPLLEQFQSVSQFPASIRERRYEISITGKTALSQESKVSYSVQVKNNSGFNASNLSANVLIPEYLSINEIVCSSNCQKNRNRISWYIGSMGDNQEIAFSLDFLVDKEKMKLHDIPFIELTSELLEGGAPMNVATIRTFIGTDGDGEFFQTSAVGDKFFISNGHAVPEYDGIIQLIRLPWHSNQTAMIVTGLTEGAVNNAGKALGSKSSFPGFDGDLVFVQGAVAITKRESNFKNEYSLSELGYENKTIFGVGTGSYTYRFFIPGNYSLSKDSNFQLLFSHSALLSITGSSLTVSLNDTPMGSVILDSTNILGGVLNVPLLPSAARSGYINKITVAVNLQVDDPCNFTNSDSQSWVRLDSDSLLTLNAVDNPVLLSYDLAQFPLPFAADQNLNVTKFVLPSEPTNIEYSVAMQIASYLGSAAGGDDFSPTISFDESILSNDISGYDLIVIGLPSRNHFIDIINDDLPQPFDTTTDTIIQKIDNYIFRYPERINLGYLQLLPSKWNAERLILVITGTSNEGLMWPVNFLIDETKRDTLEGNLTLVVDESTSHSIDTRQLLLGGTVTAFTTAIPGLEISNEPTLIPQQETENDNGVQLEKPEDNGTRPSWYPYALTISAALAMLILFVLIYKRFQK